MPDNLTQKIYTASGMTKENLFSGQKVLHLGCGHAKLDGTVGVDLLSMPEVDVVHNLDIYPWPFKDSSVDAVIAHSVLEHLSDVVKFFEEIQRISKSGARVVIEVPYFRSVDSFTDPTHKHYFTSRSLDYFLEGGNSLAGYSYTEHKMKKIGFWYGWPQPSNNLLARIFKDFIGRHSYLYDQYLSILFPVKVLFWELEVKK